MTIRLSGAAALELAEKRAATDEQSALVRWIRCRGPALESPLRDGSVSAATRVRYFETSGVGDDLVHVERLFMGPPRWPEPRAAAAAEKVLVEDRGLVLLAGGHGAGKSQFSVEMIARWTLSRGLRARYFRLDEWVEASYGRFVRGYDDHSRALRGAADHVERSAEGADLLVLDEVKLGLSRAALLRLERLIDGRYRRKHPTLLITNVVDEHLQLKMLGSNIVDRLHEMGGMAAFEWPSFRVRQPAPTPHTERAEAAAPPPPAAPKPPRARSRSHRAEPAAESPIPAPPAMPPEPAPRGPLAMGRVKARRKGTAAN